MVDKQNKEYLKTVARMSQMRQTILDATVPIHETEAEKQKRLKLMLNNRWDGFCIFAKYYFPHLCDSDFGWFHKEAFQEYRKGSYKGVWEWARNHAKSVYLILLALYDKARNIYVPNSFRGLVYASETEDMAKDLLASLQVELETNQRYIADFGVQYQYGDWAEGSFSTMDGCGFWAFGLGQNPAGLRKSAKRPTHIFADDCDNKRRAENQDRIEKDQEWLEGELLGTCDIKYACKFVYVNNRVHKYGLTAHMVGDVNPTDKVRKGIHHVKVFLTEDPVTHERLDILAGGVPAWKERYTIQQCMDMIIRLADQAERQLYHNHVLKGKTFKADKQKWVKCLPLSKYDALVTYMDPSFKGTSKNDYKGVVLVGITGMFYDVIKGFCRQCGMEEAVAFQLQTAAKCPDGAVHYYEANFIQDMHTDTFHQVSEELRLDMVVREDKDRKDEKKARIASLQPLWDYGMLRFNEAERHNPDMIRITEQFIGFPDALHDDGPDAVHGAISKLRHMRPTRVVNWEQGQYKKSKRWG